METIIGAADPMRYFGQVDLVYGRLSLHGKDFLRLLIAKLGKLNQAPVSVSLAIAGMYYALHAFLGGSSEQYGLLDELEQLKNEVDSANLNFSPNFNPRRKRAKWIKWQVYEFVNLLAISKENADLKFPGIYLFCLLKGIKHNKCIPAILFKYLNSGSSSLNDTEMRALLSMELNAKLFISNQEMDLSESFIEKVRFHYQNKIHFADAKSRQSVYDRKSYTRDEFVTICHKMNNTSDLADDELLASKPPCHALIAMFTSLPVGYVSNIPVLEGATEEWAIAIAVSEGVIYFDLSLIAPGAIEVTGEQFVLATQILVKPLPLFLATTLQHHLKSVTGNVQTIGDFVPNDIELTGISPAKLANTYSKYAGEKVDLFMGGMLSSDFRGFPKSRVYYSQITRLQVWDASKTVFAGLGFGEPVAMPEGLNIGSSAVLTDQAVTKIFSDLDENVNKTRPSNNASVEKVIWFHTKFTEYVATLAIFCLCLRDANPINIKASQVLRRQKYLIHDDKHVHEDASPQPVTICSTLHQQFVLYREHCATLLKRMKNAYEPRYGKFIHALERVVAGQDVLVFITPTSLKGLSSHEVSTTWIVAAPPNFGRHFWATHLKAQGVSDREISAHLRHQQNGALNWSTENNLVLSTLIQKIDTTQTRKLMDLDIHAIAGLSRKLS